MMMMMMMMMVVVVVVMMMMMMVMMMVRVRVRVRVKRRMAMGDGDECAMRQMNCSGRVFRRLGSAFGALECGYRTVSLDRSVRGLS